MKPNLKTFPKHKNPHLMSREAIIHSYTEWKKQFKYALGEWTAPNNEPLTDQTILFLKEIFG